MKNLPIFISSASLPVCLMLSGCETSGQNAMLGAATGAAIGGLLHGRGDQALAGAAIGAGAGYLGGKVIQNERRRAYTEGYYQGRYPQETAATYPLARRSSQRGLVISPYRPYNLVDVRGIPSGARVEDPSCGRIFINP